MLVVGLLISLAGIALLSNVSGVGDFVIRRVTSRSLGELAPGYAASPGGFKVYAALILAVGVAVTGLEITDRSALVGLILLVLGIAAFVIASAIAIAGEVRTYRALKR
ncbi:MAG TPA: hypothetical protein VND96_19775 [Candidatus Micrarchaeaceae archaeon]|nr:hypothetical protein [Candidatus Micrarchaeaceae archaeon]